MERLKGFVQRRLPLIIGLGLIVLALVFVAPRAMAWLPWNPVATQPAPPLAAGPRLPDPAVGAVPPQAPPAPAVAGPGLPNPGVGAVPPQARPEPPVAGPRPPHAEPAGPPPPPHQAGTIGGWILGWLLGGPRQWLCIALIVGGLWLLGRRRVHVAPQAIIATEPVHPETYQPAQEA